MSRGQRLTTSASGLPASDPVATSGSTPVSLVQAIIEAPPEFPGWSAATWRRALASGRLSAHSLSPLSDKCLGALLVWVARQTDPGRQMGAVADVLAVLDKGLHDGERDAAALGEQVCSAALNAKPLVPSSAVRTAGFPLWLPDQAPAHPLRTEPNPDSRLAELSRDLLRQAGFDLRANVPLASRLAAALDVAIDHWLKGSPDGGGLPEFPFEHTRFYEQRLIVKLGNDRDLLRLVSGPHPGKGRDRQAAWQRGLTYWVAIATGAHAAGEPTPSVPTVVLRHWRKELVTLLEAMPEPEVEAGIAIAGMRPLLRGDGA